MTYPLRRSIKRVFNFFKFLLFFLSYTYKYFYGFLNFRKLNFSHNFNRFSFRIWVYGDLKQLLGMHAVIVSIMFKYFIIYNLI